MTDTADLRKENERLRTALRVFQKPAIDRYKLESGAKDDPDYEPPFFQVAAWTEGRVLSADDIISLQCVLADANDEIGENADRDFECMQRILFDLGGKELVDAWGGMIEAERDAAVKKAMAHLAEKTAEIERSMKQ